MYYIFFTDKDNIQHSIFFFTRNLLKKVNNQKKPVILNLRPC